MNYAQRNLFTASIYFIFEDERINIVLFPSPELLLKVPESEVRKYIGPR